MSVGLIVDSSADLPVETAAAHGITVVINHLVLGERALLDYELAPEALYALLAREASKPSYLGVPNRELWRYYADLLQENDGVVFLLTPFGEAPMMQKARGAIGRIEGGMDRIKVISTGTGVAGQAALALAAARQRGRSPAEVFAYVERQAPLAECLVTPVQTATLRRMANVQLLEAKLGSLAAGWPILKVGGSLTGVGMASGFEQALEAMVERAARRLAGAASAVVVTHALNPEAAQRLAGVVRERLQPGELLITELGATIGAFAGRGAVGLGYAPL